MDKRFNKEFTIQEVPSDLDSETKDMIITAHSSDSHYLGYAISSEKLSRIVITDIEHLKTPLIMDVPMKVSHLSLVHSKEPKINCLFLASDDKKFGTIDLHSSNTGHFSDLNLRFQENSGEIISDLQFDQSNLYVVTSDSSQKKSSVRVFKNYTRYVNPSPSGPWNPEIYTHEGLIKKFIPSGSRGFIIEENSIKVIDLGEKEPKKLNLSETLPEKTLGVFKVSEKLGILEFFVQAETTSQIVRYSELDNMFDIPRKFLGKGWKKFFIIFKDNKYFLTWFSKNERYIGFYLTNDWINTLKNESMESIQSKGNKFYLSKGSSLGSVFITDTALSPSNNVVLFEKNSHRVLDVSKEFKEIVEKTQNGRLFKGIQEYVITGYPKTFTKVYLSEGNFMVGQLLHELIVFKLKKKSKTFVLLENIDWDIGREILNIHLVTQQDNPKVPRFLYVVTLKRIYITTISDKQAGGSGVKNKEGLKVSQNPVIEMHPHQILTTEQIGKTLFIIRQDGSFVKLEMDGKSDPKQDPKPTMSEPVKKDATNLPYILVSQEKEEAVIIEESQVTSGSEELKLRFSALQAKLFSPGNKKRFQISANRDISFVAAWDGKPNGQISCFCLMTLDETKYPSLVEFKTISLNNQELKNQLKWGLTDMRVYGATWPNNLLILKTNLTLLSYNPYDGATHNLLEPKGIKKNEGVYDLWGFAIGGKDKNEVIVSNSKNQLKTIRIIDDNLEMLQRPFQFLLYSVVITQDKLFAIYDQTSLITLPLGNEERKEKQEKISYEIIWDVSNSPISMLALKTDEKKEMSGLYVVTFDWELLLLEQKENFKQVGFQALTSEPIQLQEVLLRNANYVVMTCLNSEVTLYTADLSKVYRRIFLGVRVNTGDNFYVSTKSTESSLILYMTDPFQKGKDYIQTLTIDLKQGKNVPEKISEVEEKAKLETTVQNKKTMRKLPIDLINSAKVDPKTVSEILDGNILDLGSTGEGNLWRFFSTDKTKVTVAFLSKTGDDIRLMTRSGNNEFSVSLNPQGPKTSQKPEITLFCNEKFALQNFSSFFRVVSFEEGDSLRTKKLLDVFKEDPLLNCSERHPSIHFKLIELEEAKALFLVVPKKDESIKITGVKGSLEKTVFSVENKGHTLMAVANRNLEAVYMNKYSGTLLIERFLEKNGKIEIIENFMVPKEPSGFKSSIALKATSVYFDMSDSYS